LHISTEDNNSPGVPITAYDPALYVQVRNTRVSQRLSQCGSGRAVLIPYSLRLGSLKDLLTYAEVWALPGIVGKMSSEVAAAFSADAVANFQSMIEDFAGDSRQILPPGFDVEVLSAVAGGEKVFDLIDSLTERQIQFAIVGNVGTASGDKATYASAEVGMQVQSTLTDGDARMVGEALQGLLKQAVALKFGAGTPPPEVVFRSPVATQSATERAELYGKAVPALLAMIDKGVAIDVEEYAKIFDIPLKKVQNESI
jgi:phage gp29-like protein